MKKYRFTKQQEIIAFEEPKIEEEIQFNDEPITLSNIMLKI